MAVSVKVGDVYPDIKVGVGAKGAWGNVTVKAEKGSDRITVWFSNAVDIPEGTFAVQIDEILEVKQSAHQYNGNWIKDYMVNAKVHAVEGGATPIDLTDEGLPF